MQDTGYRIQILDSRCRIQDSTVSGYLWVNRALNWWTGNRNFRMQVAGERIKSGDAMLQDTGYRIRNPRRSWYFKVNRLQTGNRQLVTGDL